MKWIILALLLTSSAVLAETTVTVDGPATTQPIHWAPDDLKHQPAMPTTQLSYESHGTPHHATCVSLLDLLKNSGVATEIKMDPTADPKTKHAPLRMVILARATDGYGIAFSLSELIPDIGHRTVWLALDEDGKALVDRDMPAKLIVPEDTKPARWVHGVDRLTVIDLSATH